MGVLVFLFVLLVVVMLVISWVMSCKEQDKRDELVKRERKRNNNGAIDFVDLVIDGGDLPKLSGITSARDGQFKTKLIMNVDKKTVHIDRSASWELAILDIDFHPRFTHETTKSGKGGALVGGLVAGTTGAIIGGSGGKSTTVDTEVASWAIVTARRLTSTPKIIKFRALMDTNLYQKLQKDYVHPQREPKANNPQPKPQPKPEAPKPVKAMDSLTALVKLRDQGILSDGEFAEKAAKLAKQV